MNKLIAIILCLPLLLCVGCSSESESDKIINDYLEDKKPTEEDVKNNALQVEKQEAEENKHTEQHRKTNNALLSGEHVSATEYLKYCVSYDNSGHHDVTVEIRGANLDVYVNSDEADPEFDGRTIKEQEQRKELYEEIESLREEIDNQIYTYETNKKSNSICVNDNDIDILRSIDNINIKYSNSGELFSVASENDMD
ncbi:hypothetical protein SAMN02910355_1369 [Terrisporobacter glycolicus]|nr:hypothetical protein SAMN02910355_1369 [Terrisporobacter glycolicus]